MYKYKCQITVLDRLTHPRARLLSVSEEPKVELCGHLQLQQET